MKNIVIALLCVAVAGISSVAVGQGPTPPQKEHALLKKDAGVWDAKGKMWMPGVPQAMEFEGVETNEMIGELWCITDFKGNFGGMEFRGHGRSGFNVVTKKYEGAWFDSTSPHAMSMSGTYDEATKTLTMMTKGIDPTGAVKKGKTTLFYKDKDTRISTMYGADPEGGDKMVKEMQIIYTRKK